MSEQVSPESTPDPMPTSAVPAADGAGCAVSASAVSASTGSASTVSASAAVELQQLLLATDDITEFLDQLATLTAQVMPGDLSCGITLRRESGATTVASSDHRAGQVDEIQYGTTRAPA